MSTHRAQVHIDAPLDEVWALVGNPATYPQWWPAAVEIRGERFEVGDPFTQVVGIAGRRLEYSRIIERREELKELRWHCPTTGGFQHWLLTDAQGGTFVDMEMGMNPPALRYGLFDRTMGRWAIKRWAEQAVDGLRKTLAEGVEASGAVTARAPAHALTGPDVDYRGGSGRGPRYVGPEEGRGSDPNDLDRDGDSHGCED